MHTTQGPVRLAGAGLFLPGRAQNSVLRTVLSTALSALLSTAWAADDRRLSDLSLEDLSNLEITSASKRAERLSDAPASVFVITAADIRRSGATSLPEALRLAPNLQVVRVYASTYTVTARGFAGQGANKLLVLIDGRSVYSPLFSGVFWDVQEVMLEDVERIEVISGPGGTLWGVNAVNGVINVITRSAAHTQGGLAAAGGSNRESRARVRWGGKTAGGVVYTLYATRSDYRDSETSDGTPIDDAAHQTQAGFRYESDAGGASLLLEGNVYAGGSEQPSTGRTTTGEPIVAGPISTSGANVLGRWQQTLAGGGMLMTQAYLDRTARAIVPTVSDHQQIADLQLQYAAPPLGAHSAVLGAEYRRGWDRVDNSVYVAFLPARLQQAWTSVYAQDEITLAETLRLTLGARAEHNDYTGTEWLPGMRLAWNWAPHQMLWAAVARTVRAPSRLDRDLFVPGQPPYLLPGGPTVQSETAKQIELGYRGQPSAASSLSATLFQADYDRLRTQEIDPTGTHYIFANSMAGRVRGVELWGSLQAASNWRLHAGFTRLLQDLHLLPGSNDVTGVARTEGPNPGRWWTLRSSLDIGPQLEFDAALRYVGALAQPLVPSYKALDLRLGWRPSAALEVSLAARNLIGSGHGEFSTVATRMQVRRDWFAKLEARF